MRTFEFHAYPAIGPGHAPEPQITQLPFEEKAQAVAHAGRMAKRINGPVDVATVNSLEWGERYITTAMPSDYHSSGYRTERMT